MVVVACDGASDGAGVGGVPEVDAVPDAGVGDLGDQLSGAAVVALFGAARGSGEGDGELVRPEQIVDGGGEAGGDAGVVGGVFRVVRGADQRGPAGVGDGGGVAVGVGGAGGGVGAPPGVGVLAVEAGDVDVGGDEVGQGC